MNSNIAGMIADYEMGLLADDEVLDLFQELVDTGVAWSLQGSYGRMAVALIEGGLIVRPKTS